MKLEALLGLGGACLLNCAAMASQVTLSHSAPIDLVIDPSQGPFRFVYTSTSDDPGYPVGILCYKSDAARPFQVLSLAGDPTIEDIQPPYDPKEFVKAVDMNHDGFMDLQVLAMWGVTGNEIFIYYLWDPRTQVFVRDAKFDVCNGPPDQNGCCHVWWNMGDAACAFVDTTYCLKNTSFVKTRVVRQDRDESGKCLREDTRVIANGAETKSTRITCDPRVVNNPRTCKSW